LRSIARAANHARAPAWLLAAALALLGLVAILAWAVRDLPAFRDLDTEALIEASGRDHGVPGDVARTMVHLGDPLVQALLLGAGVMFALVCGRRDLAAVGLALALGADLTTLSLKHLLAAPRFDHRLGEDQIGADAFPSGHATAAFSLAFAWIVFAWSSRRRAVAAVGMTAATAVGISVVVLRWHFPSDAFGGFLVATAWACAICAIWQLCDPAQADSKDGATFGR
jgi:membrane-associated phospholipid phosphatase